MAFCTGFLSLLYVCARFFFYCTCPVGSFSYVLFFSYHRLFLTRCYHSFFNFSFPLFRGFSSSSSSSYTYCVSSAFFLMVLGCSFTIACVFFGDVDVSLKGLFFCLLFARALFAWTYT